MSTFFGKAKVSTALSGKNKFDLSCNHFTTMDFYKQKVVYAHEVMAGETFKLNMQTFTRLSPMGKPMFGSCRIVNRFFFVPFRVVFRAWNDFYTRVPSLSDGDGSILFNSVTTITDKVIRDFFISRSKEVGNWNEEDDDWNYLCAYETVRSGQRTVDFTTRNSSGTVTYYTFTPLGKLVNDILRGLGYKIDWYYDFRTGQSNFTTTMNALPLLAYYKIYLDYFVPSEYPLNNSQNDYFNNYVSLNSAFLVDFVDCIKNYCHSSDIFTTAWDNPFAGNAGTGVGLSVSDPNVTLNGTDVLFNEVTSDGSNAPNLHGKSSQGGASQTPFGITQMALNLLHSATDYLMRFRLSGSRVIDRYKAETGFTLDSAKLDRSIYLGENMCNIEISDVMQQSPDSVDGTTISGSGVGEFTGKGIGFDGKGNCHFTSDEFGMIIVTSVVEPTHLSYCDGRPRYTQHIQPMDFFHGDYDNKSVVAIRQDELVTGYNSSVKRPQNPSTPFGFQNSYYEYKTALDNLSGDFACTSRKTSLENWLSYRRYDGDFVHAHSLPVIHSKQFLVGQPSLYHNIFVDDTDYFDHFFTVFRFNVEAFLPAKPLYDVYDFEDEGRKLEMAVNGSRLTD